MAGIDDISISVQALNIEAPLLIDETSSTEYYIGTSKSFIELSKPNWRIKRIWKIGNVWRIGFPDGKQDFAFIWDDRLSYTYS